MAERFYFYIQNDKIFKKSAEFEWFPGFAVSQKQKSIASFHVAIREKGKTPLEISTKSAELLGKKLSAFSLLLEGRPLECIFQSSKVFEKGGPYAEILDMLPKDAKRDPRITSSGKLIAFRYKGIDWPLEPRTLFYDYIYYHAVREQLSLEELKTLEEYDAFTDIEFNANKSINTQARSIALVKLIFLECKCLPEMTKEEFLEAHLRYVRG